MDAIKQAQLKKSRSYTACIAEAYRMFFNNIRQIFRHTWLFSLICALSIALYSSLYINSVFNDEGQIVHYDVLLSFILMVGASIAFYARVMMLVNGQTMKMNTIKGVKVTLLGIIITFILSLFIGITAYTMGDTSLVKPESVKIFTMALIVITVIFALMALPLVFVVMKYFIDRDSRLHKIFFASYKTGLRHWGFIFTTCLITFLLATACSLLVSMPTLIILTANSLSVAGVKLIGDPSGLPSSFCAIRFATITATSFICLYINIFTIFVYYFIYGSIDTRENERKEYLKQQ